MALIGGLRYGYGKTAAFQKIGTLGVHVSALDRIQPPCRGLSFFSGG